MKQWGGLDVDYEWQIPQVEFWLQAHGFSEQRTPYDEVPCERRAVGPMLADLKGRRVLVTGASGGIGSAIARLFAEYGATLGLHYRSQQLHVQALRDEMRAGGVDAECFAADLVEPEARRCLVRLFIARFGGLDVLVNNAGAVIGADHFSALDQNSWDQTFALNVRAPFFSRDKRWRR